MYQSWDEHGGYQFMRKNREEQAKTGRPIPQVNEEYGYEDHYPYPWGEGRVAPARVADNRRRIAWEMAMAGCYQTTGERANIPGMGGWITGRGSDEVMLKGYALIREFFEGINWWKLGPRPDLVNGDALCLAEPGTQYVLILPHGGPATVTLEQGRYRTRSFHPQTGRSLRGPRVDGTEWKCLKLSTGRIG